MNKLLKKNVEIKNVSKIRRREVHLGLMDTLMLAFLWVVGCSIGSSVLGVGIMLAKCGLKKHFKVLVPVGRWRWACRHLFIL